MRFFLVLMMMCSTLAQACDDFTRIYFEIDNHLFLQVVGHCRGEVSYTVHLAECPCGTGLYEVKDPVPI